MVAFGKRPGGGRRSADRNTAPLSAVFTTVAQSHGTDLVDLSCTGARMKGTVIPSRHTELMLSVGRLRAFAKVIWTRPGQCGVKFDVPLAHDDVMSVRNSAAADGNLPPEISGAMEDWMTGFAR
jgi:hypothetical protein